MRTASPGGCARGGAVGVLLMATVIDLLYTIDMTGPLWPTVVVLAVGLAAVLWPPARRPEWLTEKRRTAVPALASVLYSVTSVVAGWHARFGPGETLILLSLLFVAVRHCPARSALTCGLATGGALLLLPVRSFTYFAEQTSVMQVALVLGGATAGLAAYLRSLDYRRTVAVGETRRAERLAIAADLHDFVAHHVTGILVQTQMARMMAATRPDELDPVLAGIERAATEALASMRRTVGVLRDTGPEIAGRHPVGDLAGIRDLTEGFAVPGQSVVLHLAPAPLDDLPHEVQAAAFRVVQEALTNVRRHAADADEIIVYLRREGRYLEVSVTDDGRGGTRLPEAARGGGFGLVGLTERVTALGGELRAGPRDGHGWQVRAVFPLRKP
ncbi:sensor histidine kinase [Streptomyces sp. TRM68367]|uniref:sensor histidine kinase n=1 Tax=Streptomyces sp. TRM68367 TaxID=2758415 RepID=UPI00165A7EFE|nr:sensor histidine kinase [Streptomyces sp. TRM68367]MBC9731327.1 sensor histidine kinase [Streptomyces sp. TRM68367]